jgi:hypothetical protein
MEKFISKVFLIGINFLDEKENLIEQYQTHGILEKIENHIMHIHREDNSHYYLPFDETSIQVAKPGIYKERSTGIEVENPDFLVQWSVVGITDYKNIYKYKDVGFEPADWVKQ